MKVDQAEVERRVAGFVGACRDAGVKLTPQRIEIFREIAASLEHPGAETVLRGVQPRMPTVSLDTVYRTLWLLEKLGLITALGPRRESVRFDANLAPHHHYVCMRCGSVLDFESADLGTLLIPDTVKHLGTVVSAHVEVRGLCAKCAKKGAKKTPPPMPTPHHPTGE